MKKIIFILSIVFCQIYGIAQSTKFYAHITDKSLVPVINESMNKQEYKYTSTNQLMQEILTESKPIKFVQAFPTAHTPWLREVYYIECEDTLMGTRLKSSFGNKIPKVEYLITPVCTAEQPNDPLYDPYQTDVFELLGTSEAYEYYFDLGIEPTALTDTYFDTFHEDINFSTINGSNDMGPSNPYYYHGTAVAGFIGAITNNQVGIASIGLDLINPVASTNRGDNEVLLLAQAGYKVINCSWFNSCYYSSAQEALYEEIRNDYDAIVVFGAGNGPSHCYATSNYVFPASYDVNISVTSVRHESTNVDGHDMAVGDTTTSYHHNDKVDICAHGYNVYTLDPMGSLGGSAGNYNNVWGTSFAAPQVAATLSVIRAINPCLSADEAENILLESADSAMLSYTYNLYYAGKLGVGRLDVLQAVKDAALSGTTTISNQTLSSSQTTEDQFGISFNNVTISSGTHNFKTRKEITINGNFQINTGVNCTFDVNPDNVISCY